MPTREQALRLLQQNPEAVRQQLLRSGLTQGEIRARLSAMGLPTDALDAFLDQTGTGPIGFDASTLAALEAMGVVAETADGLEFIDVTTGLQWPLQPADSTDGLPIFGMNVFRRATSQFQPLLSGPVPDDYRLGPGDSMVLVLTGEVELAHEISVTQAGFIVIPDVGQVSVANLTMADLRSVLRERLGRSYSGIARGSTSFEVTVTQMRTIQVYVSGEVVQPGAYQLASVATVMNALYASGGPSDLASLRSVRIARRSGERLALDLYPYLLSGDVTGDVRLEQGDVVFVPLKGRRVKVVGAVGRPAHYELAAEEDLPYALRAAGGFAGDANRERMTIHRVARPEVRGPGLVDRQAIDLALRVADGDEANAVDGVLVPPVGLQDGDSIVVDAVPPLSRGYYVTIAGMVMAPNTFPWHEGMTLRDAVLLARGPSVGADMREAEVSRLPDDRQSGELATLLRVPLDSSYLSQRDPQGRFAGPHGIAFPPPGSAPEFTLEPFDQIQILRQPDFEMPTTVRITGEVPVPGQYTLRTRDDRVTDLVQRAGGIMPTGYPEGARLVRSQDEMGRIDIDLPAALANPSGRNNVVLQAGDSLHIPVYSPTVVVSGAVNSPITVLYREDEGLDYYVENAGGYRNDADKGRLSVRYANGQARTRTKFLLWSSYPTPGPGSTIMVPEKDPADRLDTRGLITDLAAVTGSLTTVVLVIWQISRN